MVRTKNPAHHFDTLTTLSSVAGDSGTYFFINVLHYAIDGRSNTLVSQFFFYLFALVPLDESYASTPLRPSPRSNFSSASLYFKLPFPPLVKIIIIVAIIITNCFGMKLN